MSIFEGVCWNIPCLTGFQDDSLISSFFRLIYSDLTLPRGIQVSPQMPFNRNGSEQTPDAASMKKVSRQEKYMEKYEK